MLLSHLTFQKLQIFCTVAAFRSVTRAAEHIGVSQPVITDRSGRRKRRARDRLTWRVSKIQFEI
jgi:DNA-binding transcriptional LysR family regulator